MSLLGLILLILLIALLFGGLGPSIYPGSPWPYGYGLGHGGIGLIGIILIILVVLAVTGRI
jgi:hypothetical protein